MKVTLRYLSVLMCITLLATSCKKESDSVVNNLASPAVNAGVSQNLQAPVAGATLTGTATSPNGNITGYLWSLVSGPNIPAIVSPSSPTTALNSLIAGTYIFQFMAIDDAGLTGIDTMQIIIAPALQQTLTLQPSNNPTELNFAGYTNGTNVSAHQSDIDAGVWSMNGTVVTIRGAFKFDLSAIPAGATIISAKLSLYSNTTPINGDLVNANSGTDNSMLIQRITGNWSATGSTWGTQPATTTTDQIVVPHTTQQFLDLVDMDVKNMVASMVATGNYGFMMRLQNESIYNMRQFASSMHSIAAKHPKLVVVYQ